MARVLVVDDDEALREIARLVLEEAGYRVEEAPSGAAALTLLRACREPMVVLLDLIMPQMGGMEVLRRVPHDARLGRHVFILWSGHRVPRPEDIFHALDVLMLPKPCDIDDIVAVVAKAAERFDEECRA